MTVVPALGVHGMWMGKWWFDNLREHSRGRGLHLDAFDLPQHGELYTSAFWVRWISLQRSLKALLERIQQYPKPPILIGHSFGCYLIEAVLCLLPEPPPGIVLIAPTRHDVFRHSTLDFARKHRLRFAQMNCTCSMWPSVATVPLARELLFSEDMSDEQLAKFHQRLHGDSYLAAWQLLLKLGPQPCKVPGLPVLVIGGRKDNAVRAADVEHVAKFHGTSVHWCDLPHNLLLVPGWEEVATTIEDWALAIGQKSLPEPVS
jgi:alpha-beta hydrolase superfamily lysophospholipase